MFAIIIRIVLSWIAPQTYSPVTAILTSMTEPLLAPCRRFIPPMGGFDLSPVFVIILLGALSILLQDALTWLL
jgi:YggT family protein